MATCFIRKVKRSRKILLFLWIHIKDARYCFALPLAVIFIVVGLILPKNCVLKNYIPRGLIVYDVLSNENNLISVSSLPLCTIVPPNHLNFTISQQWVDIKESKNFIKRLNVNKGGSWKPSECRPRFSTAIIIPYRDREKQLDVFLFYMHHFLIRQRIAYTIFVVEQSTGKQFNRGKLFNIGFNEAAKRNPFDCYIFHDVDLLPEKLLNIYGCSSQPRHMITALDTFNYELPYCEIMGGAVALTETHFKNVNGFGNRFFGWGGEDDDFYNRVVNKKYNVIRWDPAVARYKMLSHKKEMPNEDRHFLLRESEYFFDKDGLCNLNYSIISIKELDSFTHLLVEL